MMEANRDSVERLMAELRQWDGYLMTHAATAQLLGTLANNERMLRALLARCEAAEAKAAYREGES